MYDTATAATTSIPLHGPDVSFSWSDFPMVKQEDTKYKSSSSSLCSLTSSSSSSNNSNHSHISSTLSDFSSTSSCMNLLDGSSDSSSTSSLRNSFSSQRNVRFSQYLEVRTYNLVLGDHPLGSNGLAIEHGWDYDSHDGEKINMKLHEDCKHNTNWSRQRSHLDKKRLLLEVAGCSVEELNERTNTYQEEQRAVAAAQPMMFWF